MDPRRRLRGPMPAILVAASMLVGCQPAAVANPAANTAANPAANPAAPSAPAAQTGADGRGVPSDLAAPSAQTAANSGPSPTLQPAPANAAPDGDGDRAGGGQIIDPSFPWLLEGVNPIAPAAPSAAPALPRPTQSFAMNLYASGDFVAQYTFEWCVGASIQMALNMIGDSNNLTRARQEELWELAQSLSVSQFGGANARGWTMALNVLGTGPYRLVSEPDLDSALRRAAAAIRETRRPVGLLMWRGRHAWVMSGFTSLGDPATIPNFEVTGARVLDPLYPHGNAVWGPSARPNALLTPTKLGEQFVIRDRGRTNYGIPPGWFLVLPLSVDASDESAG